MEKKLGLSALTAPVLSSMLGAGVFSLPQNMAAVASPSALLIGWAITGVGILFLAFAMLLLTRIRPDLDGGIFTYAREGFGELIGFCSARGYWLCAVIANVSYLVIVFSALSFSPIPLSCACLAMVIHGSLSLARRFCCGSSTFWSCAVSRRQRGLTRWPPSPSFCRWAPSSRSPPRPFSWIRSASILAAGAGRAGMGAGQKHHADHPVGVYRRGGAVVVSARARHKRDVGRATLLAVLSALAVYLLVTLLSLGVVPRSELAEMRNPSMAGLMVRLMGSWGRSSLPPG